MSRPSNYEERAAQNDASRNHADRYGQEWSDTDLELLRECWGDVPEQEVAEALGRTIEACRQRFYEDRRGYHVTHHRTHTVTKTTTTTTARYIGAADDEDEPHWWDPTFYEK